METKQENKDENSLEIPGYGEEKDFEISKLQMPKMFYPRRNVNMSVAKKYADMMEAGAVFPAIKVGELHNHLIVVDGWHRCHAHMIRKDKIIVGKLKKYTSERDLFRDAVLLNQGHGYSLNKVDRRRSAKMLKMFKFDINEIVKLTSVSKKDIVRRWEKKEETTVLVASGPGGRRLDLVIQDPTITVRTRIIEALEISKVDDVQDTIIIVCNGKRKEQTMILPLNGQTVDAQDKIKSALSAAQVNGLYDVANTLERALQQVNMRR